MKFNNDNTKLFITGTLTRLVHAPLNYDGGKKQSKEAYFQVSVLAPEDPEGAKAIRALAYSSAASEFIPKWVKGEEKPNDSGEIYYNFKSLYDLKYFMPEESRDYSAALSYDDLLERCNGAPPYGSNVTLSVRIKEGALYADALRINILKIVSVDDYFS